MTVRWMARRWCVVEQDEQQDLFVGDPWHLHLADINMRLDVPRERTLCGDLLPSRPVYRELIKPLLTMLCPQCHALAQSLRGGATGRPKAPTPELVLGSAQIDLYPDNGASRR